MHILKKNILKLYDSQYFPFFILSIGMLGLHFVIPLGTGDDIWFREIHLKTDLVSFLITRYNQWTSRLIIETTLGLMVHFETVWRTCNFIMVVLSAIIISKEFVKVNTRNANWLITALMFIYPFSQMSSAGWIATSLNYYWPLVLGLIAIIPIKKILNKERIKWYEYIVYSIAFLYSTNQEQMCLILFAVYSVFLIYQIINKKPFVFAVFSLFICSSSLIFILTCPGNFARKISEVGRWFPSFDDIHIIRKIEMGFSSSSFELIMKPNFVFTIFSGLLLILMINKYSKPFYRAIGAIPFISSLVFGAFGNLTMFMFPSITKIINSMTNIGTGIKFSIIKSWIPDLIIIFVFVCIIISLLLIFEKRRDSFLVIFILLLGFGSRMVMSFSPTIWASGTRTFVFMYFSLIIASVVLYNEISKNKNIRFIGLFTPIVSTIAILSIINSFMEI